MYGYTYGYPSGGGSNSVVGNFGARVNADGGLVESPTLAGAFVNVVEAQGLTSSLVFSGLPAYKNTTSLVDKWYDINANDGAGTTTTRPTLVEFAPDFDGIDDFISVAHNANQLLTGGGCLMAWIRPDTIVATSVVTEYSRIIDKSDTASAGNGFFWGIGNNNRMGFQIGSGAGRVSNSVLVANTWQHIAVVFTSLGVPTFYRNGALVLTQAATGVASLITTTNPTSIGNRSISTDRPMDGEIVLPSIFAGVLSAEQILNTYNQTAPFFT
jgi:hypothetical protein